MKCCICKKEIEKIGSWDQGNNAQPLKEGRCCDNCNMTRVLPERMRKMGIGVGN
jgi:hypothetical protein